MRPLRSGSGSSSQPRSTPGLPGLLLSVFLVGLTLAGDPEVRPTPPPGIGTFPSDEAFPGRGPIRKADWFQNLWIQRRSQWWQHRAEDHAAVVFLGDSITQGWTTLARDFPGLKVANRGISGDVTRGVLCRLKEDVLDLDPRAVVLLIGTNDLEERADPEVIAENVKTILARCHQHNPQMPIVVCRVMPSSEKMKRPADKIRRINALVDDVVRAEPHAIRCDTWTPFADGAGDAKSEEFPDLLHPNAAGYAKWAAALKPVFEDLRLAR